MRSFGLLEIIISLNKFEIEMIEERVSELEDRAIEMTLFKLQKKRLTSGLNIIYKV